MSLTEGSIVTLPGGVEAVATAVMNNQGQQVSDFSPVVEFPAPPANSLLSAVAYSASEVIAKVANPDRRGLLLVNSTDKQIYIAFSDHVTFASFSFIMAPGSTYEGPIGGYTGRVMALWNGEPSVFAYLHVTELLA